LRLDVFQALGLDIKVKETPEFSQIFPSDCDARLRDHENPRKNPKMLSGCAKKP
jgi:hypothetical protein